MKKQILFFWALYLEKRDFTVYDHIGIIYLRLCIPGYTPPKLNSTYIKSTQKNDTNDKSTVQTLNSFSSDNHNEKLTTTIPSKWSNSYCQELIHQNEILLKQGREQTKLLENLTNLFTEGVSSLHENLKCLNLQVRQVMIRMDQMAQNQVLTANLNHADGLQNASKKIFQEQVHQNQIL